MPSVDTREYGLYGFVDLAKASHVPERREIIHEDPVLQLMRTNHFPILTALERQTGDDKAQRLGEEMRWSLCGPFSVVNSRIANAFQDIPITRHGPGPRIELAISYYRPPDDPFMEMDHTYLLYHPGEQDDDGRDIVYFADSVYNPLFRKEGSMGNIVIRRYTTDTLSDRLEHDYYLESPKRHMDYFTNSPRFVLNPPDPERLEDLLAAFHTDQITNGEPYLGVSGKPRDEGTWGRQIFNTVREFIPGWNELKTDTPIILFDARKERSSL